MRSMGKESVRAEILGFSSLVRFGRICVGGGGGAYAERTRDDQSKEGEGGFLCVCVALEPAKDGKTLGLYLWRSYWCSPGRL